tara:strand:- start:1945 stop:2865 length:921 start_codon:yes stop_codon:yes gene_type:complete
MPFIKVPEFKSGEVIDSSQFNDAFGAFSDLNLDGENFADESLGPDQIPDGISLTDSSNITVDNTAFSVANINMQKDHSFDPFHNPGSLYTGVRSRLDNHPNNNRIALSGLEAGEKFIIRATCAISVPDGGWRTFNGGVPPIFKIGLVQFPNESSITDGSSSSLSNPIDQTVAHYRIAFTGKVPSASSLSEEATGLFPSRSMDYSTDYAYRDNRKESRGGPEIYDPVSSGKLGMPFSGYHSYTTAYLYEHSGAYSTQSFGVMCWFGGQQAGVPLDPFSGGSLGCQTPTRDEVALVKDFRLYCYQVKK